MSDAAALDARLEMTGRLFPFAFGVDPDDRLLWAGPSLRRLLPEMAPGRSMHDHFTISRPDGVRSLWQLSQERGQLVLLDHTLLDLTFRGQVVYEDAGSRFFMGGPWLRSEEAARELGLNVGDFAPHDPTLDMLFLLRTQTIVSEQAERLAQRLQRMHAEAEATRHAKAGLLAALAHDLRTPLHALGGLVEMATAGIATRADLSTAGGLVHQLGGVLDRVEGLASASERPSSASRWSVGTLLEALEEAGATLTHTPPALLTTLVTAGQTKAALRRVVLVARDRSPDRRPTVRVTRGPAHVQLRIYPWPETHSLSDIERAAAQAALASEGGTLSVERNTLVAELPFFAGGVPPEPPEPTRPLRILVADDAPQNLRFARWVLEERGHEVIEAADALEAVERAHEQPPDLVLMDLEMPRQDGLSAAAEIIETHRSAGTTPPPIIAVSAHDLQVMRAQCERAGMSGFLGKPFTATQLLAMCATHTTSQSTDSPAPTGRSASHPARPALPQWLMEAYAKDLETSLLELEGAEDPAQVRKTAHRIAGAAGTYGHRALCEAAAALESADDAGPGWAQAISRTVQAARAVLQDPASS